MYLASCMISVPVHFSSGTSSTSVICVCEKRRRWRLRSLIWALLLAKAINTKIYCLWLNFGIIRIDLHSRSVGRKHSWLYIVLTLTSWRPTSVSHVLKFLSITSSNYLPIIKDLGALDFSKLLGRIFTQSPYCWSRGQFIEDLTWVLMFRWLYLTSWGKVIKCEACRAFHYFFASSLINSMIQEHTC